MTHFQIQDYGGIINYSETMAKGLKSLGCEVDSIMLKNKGVSGVPKTKDRSQEDGWQFGEGLGLWFHQKKGWEGMHQYNYKSDNLWEEMVEKYDLVIHVIPVPTCTKANKDDISWLKLFDVMTTQLAIVHDGNMQKLYPHILEICDNIDGVIAVHDAAYNSCSVLPVRTAFIPNPHNIPFPNPILNMNRRDDALVSFQTFKRWKRVDDLIRAIDRMDEFTDKYICGGGIEYHYMTSKTKCKPEYLDQDGNKIWDNAVENNMTYLGYVTTNKRDELLANSKLLVDPSWSKNYSKLGCHFNRVMIEAMIMGCVPVCTDLAMKDSMYFKAGNNYIEVPYNCTPEQYAEILDNAIENEELLQTIQDNNLKLLPKFDMSTIAKNVLRFAQGGYKYSTGAPTEKFKADAAKKMEHFDELY